MSDLMVCPCGKTPSFLSISENGQGAKWAEVTGDCCGEWSVEFRTNYTGHDSKACKTLARMAWNEATRAKQLIAEEK